MVAPIALDLTRLALAPVRRVPRGIDRVELAYARHFLNEWPHDCLPVLPMPWGVRCYERHRAVALLEAIEALWNETIEPSQDRCFAEVKAFLAGRDGAAAAPPGQALRLTRTEQVRGFLRLAAATGLSVGRSAGRNLPRGAIYLNVGQLEVFRPFMSWQQRRPDVRGVFMIHDLIPLELPEHHIKLGVRLHQAIMRNTAAFAAALIVPSNHVRDRVLHEMSKHRRDRLPVHVELLPVSREFLQPGADDPELSNIGYFVVCSAIDSYKNHILLLEVWQRLVAARGSRAPKLVIAGTPGTTSAAVIDRYRDCPAIHSHVAIRSGLSTPALRQLIANARALLMPSLAEGFGLPVIEALAQGTPVVASDIPAHREAGAGGDVVYLDPTDCEQWLARIEQLAASPRGVAGNSSGYKPKTWDGYFRGIEAFLTTLSAPGAASYVG
jgi:glycosyltransferase involved in cell wall biosynthesis